MLVSKPQLPTLLKQAYSYVFPKTNGSKNSPIPEQKQTPEVFCKKCALKNFANFTGKHLCWSQRYE